MAKPQKKPEIAAAAVDEAAAAAAAPEGAKQDNRLVLTEKQKALVKLFGVKTQSRRQAGTKTEEGPIPDAISKAKVSVTPKGLYYGFATIANTSTQARQQNLVKLKVTAEKKEDAVIALMKAIDAKFTDKNGLKRSKYLVDVTPAVKEAVPQTPDTDMFFLESDEPAPNPIEYPADADVATTTGSAHGTAPNMQDVKDETVAEI